MPMENMLIQFDAHVHIYPRCDLSLAVNYSLKNMQTFCREANKKNAVHIWLLTERSDCHQYRALAEQRQVGEYKVEKTDEKKALILMRRGEPALYIMPGRQIVTREGLELCALISHFEIADRQYKAADAIKILHDAGAVVALNWAPGKWFFDRGRIVRQILEQAPDGLFISDTTMRPTIWPMPRLMRRAIQNGLRLLYGSDPLPFAGEEKMFGSYGGTIVGPFSVNRPAGSMRELLSNSSIPVEAFGQRSDAIQFAWRQWRIMREKKGRS